MQLILSALQQSGNSEWKWKILWKKNKSWFKHKMINNEIKEIFFALFVVVFCLLFVSELRTSTGNTDIRISFWNIGHRHHLHRVSRFCLLLFWFIHSKNANNDNNKITSQRVPWSLFFLWYVFFLFYNSKIHLIHWGHNLVCVCTQLNREQKKVFDKISI